MVSNSNSNFFCSFLGYTFSNRNGSNPTRLGAKDVGYFIRRTFKGGFQDKLRYLRGLSTSSGKKNVWENHPSHKQPITNHCVPTCILWIISLLLKNCLLLQAEHKLMKHKGIKIQAKINRFLTSNLSFIVIHIHWNKNTFNFFLFINIDSDVWKKKDWIQGSWKIFCWGLQLELYKRWGCYKFYNNLKPKDICRNFSCPAKMEPSFWGSHFD